jgi:hypothetical protein
MVCARKETAMSGRLHMIGWTVVVVVLAFANGVKFARHQPLSEDLSYRFEHMFHHQEPGWRQMLHLD